SGLLLLPLIVELSACCGVEALPTNGRGAVATVNGNGEVVFEALTVGSTASFDIPVHETASRESETLLGASLDGPGKAAFKIVSASAIVVPADEQATVTLEFAPDAEGAFSAELLLQTAKMGVSTISLSGTGTLRAGP